MQALFSHKNVAQSCVCYTVVLYYVSNFDPRICVCMPSRVLVKENTRHAEGTSAKKDSPRAVPGVDDSPPPCGSR